MSVRTKLGIAFSITALFLLAVGIAAILLINQLNPLLEQETRYDVQMRLAADTIAAMRLQPTQTQQHLARLTDLDNWANTRDERILVHQARDEVMHDRAISGAIGKLEQLSAVYRDGAAAVHQKLLRVHRRAVLWATIAIGESFVLLIIFTFLVREWLVKPVLLLRATSEQLAAGTLAQPVRAAGSGVFGVIAASLNKVAASHNDMSERLSKAERLAVVGEGYNHVTHNMRNLFAAIHSLAQYERNAPGTSADAKAAFDQITAMADTLNRWARDLMAAGRPLELKPVRQQIEPVIYDSLSMLKPSIVEKAVEVEFEPDVLPDVQIDRTLLEQALVAILANAIDASPRKGRIVVVAKGDANDTVLVSVEDEGEGMSEDVKRKVFDQYFSTKPKSVGLGLTVAHRIVTLHGGKIEIDSQPDQGTRVHVHLPASAKR